ncbi:MAG TPA: hypothetical protein PLZ69_01005 [Candidatus Pacearchaeota archaeon]|nr:hypothetical protein [Candidatus Pacearchaeota archaeon]
MLIQILTPVGYNHAPEFWISLLNFNQYCAENNIQISFRHNRMSNIYFARDKLLKSAIEEIPNYDYILWIDSDAKFNAMDVERLIAADKDVIGGCARFYNPRTSSFVYNFGRYFPESWKDLNIFMVNHQAKDELPEDLFEVDYTGCHFLLMKKGVAESIDFPRFPMIDWKELDKSLAGIKGYMSEDGAFCFKLKQAGHKIWIDPKTHIGHIKEFNIGDLQLR